MTPLLKAPWRERIILMTAGAAAGSALTVLLLPRNPAESVPPPGPLPQHAAATAPTTPAAAGPASASAAAGFKAESPTAADGARLKELEQLDKEANDRLIEAQGQLAEGRRRIFEKDFALRQAFETWRINNDRSISLSSRDMDSSGWWSIQKDPRTREAMGKAARMLFVREMAATIQDPDTKGWVEAWAVHPAHNGHIPSREKYWNDPSAKFPNFAILPPPAVVESLLNSATLAGALQNFQLSGEERELIDPLVFAYLEEAAQVRMLAVSGECYYNQHKGPELETLEKRAEEMNLAAIQTTKDLREYTEKRNSGTHPPP